jgi:hypothetical protein
MAWIVASAFIAFAISIVAADHHVSPLVAAPLPFAVLGVVWLIRRGRARRPTSSEASE